MSAEELVSPPVLFTAAAGPVSLTCCVRQKAGGNVNLSLELLVLDAAQSRGWSSQFSVSTVNAALQDEELTGPELLQVLAAVLPCQSAVTAVLQPGGQLRLEAWCHRTQRVPLLPPNSVQRQAGSDYRQAAFCISLPVSLQLSEPQWMQEQRGQAFADIHTGFLAAVLQRDQLLQDSLLRLQSQLQLVCSHSAQLQVLAEKAVRSAVRGTPGLKQDPTKQQQPNLNSPSGGPSARDAGNAAGAAAAEAAAVPFAASQLPASPGNAIIGTQGLAILGSQLPPAAAAAAGGAAGPLLPFNPMLLTQRAGSGGALRAGSGGPIMPVSPAAGNGGSSSRLYKVAGAAGGRAHLARQSQDEKALRQMWTEQQVLLQDWQQRLHPLVNCQGSLETYLQLVDRVGGGSVPVVHRAVAAQPWHLGQQQQEEEAVEQDGEQQEPEKAYAKLAEQQEQEQGKADLQRIPGAAAPGLGATQSAGPTANTASTAAGSVAAAATADSSSMQEVAGGAGPPAAIALVAPAKQRQAGKRKAHDGQPLLKRRR